MTTWACAKRSGICSPTHDARDTRPRLARGIIRDGPCRAGGRRTPAQLIREEPKSDRHGTCFLRSVQTLTRPLHTGRLSDSWREEIRGIVRAFSGAFLFGVPLLYTMEMWWLGQIASPGDLLLMLGIALLANFALVTVAGFKRETSLFARLEQTLAAVAVGVVGAAVVL